MHALMCVCLSCTCREPYIIQYNTILLRYIDVDPRNQARDACVCMCTWVCRVPSSIHDFICDMNTSVPLRWLTSLLTHHLRFINISPAIRNLSDVSEFSMEALGRGSRSLTTVWPSFSPHIPTFKMLRDIIMHYTPKKTTTHTHKHLAKSAPLHVTTNWPHHNPMVYASANTHTSTNTTVACIAVQIKQSRMKLKKKDSPIVNPV